MEKKLVVVTGGAGFIGSHLCERLVKDGHRVISLDNYFTGTKDNHVPGVEYREGHTKDIAKHIPEDPDIIYHLGEYSRVRHSLSEPAVTFGLNLEGTVGVLEYWRDRRCKLVYAGSSTKFGEREEDGVKGKDLAPYTWTKASMSDLVAQYARWFELPYAIVYFYSVYGSRERGDQYGTLIEILHQNWLQGIPHRLAGSGNQRRAFTHVLDTVDGIVLAGEKGLGDEYGICASEDFSLLDVARMFGGHIEYSSPTKSTRSSEAVNSEKIKSLGWVQRHTLPQYVEMLKREGEHIRVKSEVNFSALQPKKRILIFSLAYYPNFHGGAEPAIKEITDRVDPGEIEFHMVTCRWNSNAPRVERYGNILVHRIGIGTPDPTFASYGRLPLKLNKYYFQVAGALKALQLHSQYRYNAVWAMMAHSAGIPAMLFTLCAPKVSFILSLQEGDPKEHIMRVMRPVWPLFKKVFTSADVVQSISEYLSLWAREMGYVGEVQHIKNGANPNDLKEMFSQEDVEVLKRELGKKPGEVFLVNTSRLVYQKGFDTIIEALQYLPRHIRFVAVGDGEDEAKLRDLARRLGVSDRVTFTGRVDRSVVTLYRRACDIFVAPSRSEGLGNAFVSALASRIPLITSGVGGIADYAKDGVTAWIVEPDNPRALAEKIQEVIQSPEKAKEISSRARALVEVEYDWDKIALSMKEKVFLKVTV